MIKLRCLEVTPKSTFFVGDICKVTWFNDSKVEFNDGTTEVMKRFEFAQGELYADHTWWRVLRIPNTEVII